MCNFGSRQRNVFEIKGCRNREILLCLVKTYWTVLFKKWYLSCVELFWRYTPYHTVFICSDENFLFVNVNGMEWYTKNQVCCKSTWFNWQVQKVIFSSAFITRRRGTGSAGEQGIFVFKFLFYLYTFCGFVEKKRSVRKYWICLFVRIEIVVIAFQWTREDVSKHWITNFKNVELYVLNNVLSLLGMMCFSIIWIVAFIALYIAAS